MNRGVQATATMIMVLAIPVQVWAQPVKPNILLIFDTSGSMIYPNYDGDGSPLCNGNGQANRIYQLKEAIRNAVLYVGTDEVNFGLARFPAQVDPNAAPVCPQGRYYVVHDPPGPQGAGGYGSNSLDNSYDAWYGVYLTTGCKMSTHVGETTYGAWFTAGESETIVVPVTDPVSGSYDPSDGNIPYILQWLDGEETASGGVMTNQEIRVKSNTSDPTNILFWTPLGRSLFYARMYFQNQVIPGENPSVLPCRNNIIILITDGEESCDCADGDPNTCSSSCEFSPVRQACLLRTQANIRTYVVTLPSLVTDNHALAQAGGTGDAIGADFTDADDVKSKLLGIIAEAVPSGEICNNVDDNCNGQTDEGVKNQCGTFPNWCDVEACNNIDDDCDGQTDEGLPLNACGGPCGAPVPHEVCNGIDDDCDGLLDKADPDYFTGPDASCPCEVEVCDGIDNDCDGLIDGLDSDYNVPTGTCGGVPNLGQCQAGHWDCSPNPDNNNQVEEHCVGAVGPTPETCNGLDDDCNGVPDDVTYNPSQCVVPNCTTGCCDGHWECQGGIDVCVPDAVGTEEICNGLDDNCDSRIDEGASCQVPYICFYGTCVERIPPDGCQNGQLAIDGLCLDDPCVASHCPSGQICDPTQGDEAHQYCFDPCSATTCDSGKSCDVVCDDNGCRGDCVANDCYLDPTMCSDGQICKDGHCIDDACFGSSAMDCGNQACRDGACVDTCVDVQCGENKQCIDGECQDMDCDSSKCPPGRVCVQGQCAQDPCGGVMCGSGRVCRHGSCIDDPCRLIVCPSGSQCDERGQCVSSEPVEQDGGVSDSGTGRDGGQNQRDASVLDAAAGDGQVGPKDFSVSASGGGGCACHASGSSRMPWLPFIFAGLFFVLRRRR